jgi:hypothetical protein
MVNFNEIVSRKIVAFYSNAQSILQWYLSQEKGPKPMSNIEWLRAFWSS